MPSPPLSIVQSLSPRIAVLTSDDVIQSCEANGCRGLEELLRPWEGSTERVSIMSSTLTPTIHPTFPLRFVSYGSIFPAPELSTPNADVTVDLISSFVGARKPDEDQHYPLTRSLLLSSRPITSHETFNHPVAILLGISTSTPEPMEALQRLVGRAAGPMSQVIPWMDGVNIMRFFVVVHDVSKMGDDLKPAHDLLAIVKKVYGPHSTLLVINSQVERRSEPSSPDITTHPSTPLPRPFTPDNINPSALSQVYASALSSLTLSPLAASNALSEDSAFDTPASPTKPLRRKRYGVKLNAEDTQRLAALVRELVVQSLVPWMEARVREWNEVWHTNRRGITGRLFGAGRKFFGSRPNSPSPNAAPTGYNTVKGYYPVIAVEALTRRLADFAFMLRDYRFSSTVYDSLRRDFAQDRAWRYAAAATEMYGLSLLLSHIYFLPSSPPIQPSSPFTTLQHTDISSWLEQAVLAYQGRAPLNQIQLDALRITVLYYEAWKTIGEWRGVGTALVRAAGEADEVPSAVMIEEAASADVKGGKSDRGRRRKAFHLVQAANRYETAGLKAYSRRCLERAAQIYKDAPWTAAQDRIEYSLGRQAYTLGQSDIAVQHFLRLLRKEDTGSPGSQGGVLEDMALAYEQLVAHPELLASASDKLRLPTPVFDAKATQIVIPSSHASGSGTSGRWAELEQQALDTWDRKGKKPMSLLPDPKRIIASVDETFHIELLATNPLNAPLVLSDIVISTDSSEFLDVASVSEVTLDPYESRTVLVPVLAKSRSTITITSVSFLFHRFFPCAQSLQRQGRRLYATKAHRLTPTYAADTSLTVEIGVSKPRLALEIEDLPSDLYVGEGYETTLVLRNEGKVAVENVQLVASEQSVIRLKKAPSDTPHKDTIASIPNTLSTNSPLLIYSSVIQPGSIVHVPIIISSTRPGLLELNTLALFSNAEDDNDISSFPLSVVLEMSPLVDLSASTRYARAGPDEYLVGLEISNTSSSTLAVDNIWPIGTYWQAESSRRENTLLHSRQVYRHLLNVTRHPSTGIDLAQDNLVTGLRKLIQGVTDLSQELSPSDISFSAGLDPEILDVYLASRTISRLNYLRIAFPTIPESTLTLIFPLLDPLDLDIAVSWSLTADPSRHGIAILHGVRVAPEFSLVEQVRKDVNDAITRGDKTTRTMYEETGRLRRILMDSVLEGVLSKEDDPIEVRVKIAGKGGKSAHDFAKGSLVLPVVFSVRNRSPALSARWILRLPPPNGQHTSLLIPPHFTGLLDHRGELAPLATHEVHVALWVTQPGTISLAGWQLLVETGDVEPVGEGEKERKWSPRRNWERQAESGWVEVVQLQSQN